MPDILGSGYATLPRDKCQYFDSADLETVGAKAFLRHFSKKNDKEIRSENQALKLQNSNT